MWTTQHQAAQETCSGTPDTLSAERAVSSRVCQARHHITVEFVSSYTSATTSEYHVISLNTAFLRLNIALAKSLAKSLSNPLERILRDQVYI